MATTLATARRRNGFVASPSLARASAGGTDVAGPETRVLAREIAEFFQHENGALRAASDELEGALLHAGGSNYRRVQEAVATLRLLCGRFEVEARSRFRDEESIFFPLLEMKAPHLRAQVGELKGELDRFRRALAEFRRELTIFNTSGELRHLPRLGRDLARTLRAYLDHQEQQLLPALLGSLGEPELASWHSDFRDVARL